MRNRLALSLAAIASLWLGPAAAQDAVVDPGFTGLAALAAENPAAALDEIDRTLTALAATTPDPRVLHDLNALAADLLEATGRQAEAAAVLERLGQFVVRYRDLLQIDPVPLWRRASADYEALGDLRAALRVETAILEELRDGGLPGEVLAATLERMAVLADGRADPGAAASYRAAATEARQAVLPPEGSRGPGEGYKRIEVFYATDRARTGNPYPAEFYGAGRGPLDYGVAEVTIPDTHTAGAIEAPSVWKLEFGPSAAKHVLLRSVQPVDETVFFDRMQDHLRTHARKEVVVFIHGFNVSFDSAAKRAAQLAYDMSYTGTPVLYSWPSQGSTVGYLSDAAVVQLSARRLTRFLDDLVERSGASTIHIVAHSMGNRALTEALELMALRRGQTADMPPVFDQIVFAAPDVDAGLFAEMIPTIRPLARRLTLYASENDWALVASRKLHGDAPRAGQGGVGTLVGPDIDSVDMSDLGQDMLAHGYFADDSSALVDLVALFWRNIPPEQRCGLERHGGDGNLAVWRYLPGSCPDNALLAVMGTLQEHEVSTEVAARETVEEVVSDPALQSRIEPLILRMLFH